VEKRGRERGEACSPAYAFSLLAEFPVIGQFPNHLGVTENKIVHLLGLDWQIQTSTVGFANPTGAIGRIIFLEMP